MSHRVAVPAGLALSAFLTLQPSIAVAQSGGEALVTRKVVNGTISASNMNGCPSCSLSGKFRISFSSQVGLMASSVDQRNNILIEEFDLNYKGPSGGRQFGKDDVLITAMMNPATRDPMDLQIHGAVAGQNMAYGQEFDFALGKMAQFYDPALRDRGSQMVLGTATPVVAWGASAVASAASAAATIVPPHVGKLIFENPLFRLYPRMVYGTTRCEGASLVFKVDESYVIDSDATYRALFDAEVLPRFREACPAVVEHGWIQINNYVDGWLLFADAVLRPSELTRDYEKTRPDPLNEIVFVRDESGAFQMKDLMPHAPTSVRAKKIQVKLRPTP